MTHQRHLIRDAVVALLVAMPQTAAGARVFPNRVIPVQHREVPMIAVYTLREDVKPYSDSPRILKRTLELGITIIEARTEDDPVDALVDLIAEQVEAKLRVDRTLGGLCQDVIYNGFDAAFDHKGLELTGGGRLRYQVIYETTEPEGDLDPAPFEEAHTDFDLAPPDGETEASDDVDLPQ